MRLMGSEINRFREQGFLFPIDAVDEEEAGELAAALRRYELIVEQSGDQFLKLHIHFPKIHLLMRWADRLVHEPNILDAVECLIGPNILAWSSGIFTRQAGSPAQLAWHQDVVYFGLENFDRAVRVWIGLTPTGPENGTMQFAPGSHQQGILKHGYTSTDTASIAKGEEICSDIDKTKAVDVILRAGQCSIHHFATAHASGPSRAAFDRINFTVDYVAPDVRPVTKPDSALLVRGHDPVGHYQMEHRPEQDFGLEELTEFFKAVKMRDWRIMTEMKRFQAA